MLAVEQVMKKRKKKRAFHCVPLLLGKDTMNTHTHTVEYGQVCGGVCVCMCVHASYPKVMAYKWPTGPDSNPPPLMLYLLIPNLGGVNSGSHSPNNAPLHLSTAPAHRAPEHSVTSIALNRQRFSGLHH